MQFAPSQHFSPEPWHVPQKAMLLKTAKQRSTQSGPTGPATGLGVGVIASHFGSLAGSMLLVKPPFWLRFFPIPHWIWQFS